MATNTTEHILNVAQLLETILTAEEGCRLKHYKDSLGNETVGIGWCILKSPLSDDDCAIVFCESILTQEQKNWREKNSFIKPDNIFSMLVNDNIAISQEQADVLLMRKIDDIYASLSHSFPNFFSLSEIRQCVLLSMGYQMGITKLLGFALTLQYIKDEKYDKAADEMLQSVWAEQCPARAQRMSNMMLTNTLPDYYN